MFVGLENQRAARASRIFESNSESAEVRSQGNNGVRRSTLDLMRSAFRDKHFFQTGIALGDFL